jgi:hypothetical protein
MMSPADRTCHGGSQKVLSQNTTVNSIPSTRWRSARQRSHLQTAAYLLDAGQELPNVNEEDINHICAIHSWYSWAGSEPSEGQITDQEKVPVQADHYPLDKGNSKRSFSDHLFEILTTDTS